MRVSLGVAILCAIAGFVAATNWSSAQNPNDIRIATATPAAAQTGKFKFILFWKENNAATQGMTEALKKSVSSRSQRAEWTSVNVTEATQRAVVERYHVERAPMPMVLCVAPNGAITGGITKNISDKAIEDALVTPGMCESAKAIQDKRIVVIHVKSDSQSALPAGATDFMGDPDFKARTSLVSVVMGDPAESRFVKEMEIKPGDVSDSMVVIIAPPGAFVGKFGSGATASQIMTALHAAGKCCNDPNCKHNQKGK